MLQLRSRRGPIVTAVVLVALLVGLAPIGPTARMIPAASAAGATVGFPVNRTFIRGEVDDGDIAVADLDNDADIDVVVASEWYDVVLLNDGSGALSQAFDLDETVYDAGGVALGDLDNDGDNDIVVANRDNQSLSYLNNGSAGFTAGPTFGTATDFSSSVALGDLNNDGRLDVVLGGLGQANRIFLSGATALTYTASTLGSNASGVAIGDLDGDSDLDLAFSVNSGQSAYYLNSGSGTFGTAQAVGPANAPSRDVALGDINGDGRLDMVVANNNQRSVAYLNAASNRFNTSTVLGPSQGSSDTSENLSIGDIDADGDLDILVGNESGNNDLYLNAGGGNFAANPLNITGDAGSDGSALADMDGDRDMDVLIGRNDQLFIYDNDGGGGAQDQVEIGEPNDSIGTAITGDMNGDGRLDIVTSRRYTDNSGPSPVVVNVGAVYLNDNNRFTAPERRSFTIGDEILYPLAVGDVDNDNDLDLIFAIGAGANVLYKNDGSGNLSLAQTFTMSDNAEILARALGDLDGDGDLDLVLGNSRGIRTLTNQNGTFGPENGPSDSSGDILALALGDLDGDSDLDLVARTGYTGMHVYLNSGNGTLSAPTRYGVIGQNLGLGLALADFDGDGDLDAAMSDRDQLGTIYFNDGRAGFGTQSRFGSREETIFPADIDSDGDIDMVTLNAVSTATNIYLNDGAADFRFSRSFPIDTVALGDFDNNGTIDMVGSDFNDEFVIFNTMGRSRGLPNNTPSISITHPIATAAASGYTSPLILTAAQIPISYRLSDPEGETVRRVRGEFSLDGGGSWRAAVATAATDTTDLAAPPAGASYTFTWDTFASGVFGRNDNVVFRLIAEPDARTVARQTPSLTQFGTVSATSLPFRVRGAQVRVLRNSAAVPNATVYRIPSGQSSGAAIGRSDGTPYASDAQGFLPGRGGLAIGDKLIALLPISTDEKYTRYLTSAAVGASGPSLFSVAQPGVQTLTIGQANPLLAISLTVSLEWDARKDTLFLDQLKADLRRSSELLYIWSDGQIVLGKITIYHNKTNWTTADVQISASNSLRPNANQGGIVRADRTDPDKPSLKYEPGQIRMGAVWTRFGDATGQDGEDWPRSFAHELGHWALFLDEDYLGFDANKRLVTVEGCASPMADPYRNDYGQFRGETPAVCQPTLNQQISGRSNWDTIKTFYDDAGLSWRLNKPASFAPSSGPSSLPFAITTISEVLPSSSTDPLLAVPIFSMQTTGGTRYLATGGAKAMLFSADGTRITDLGLPERGEVNARGARVGDRLCVFDIDSETSGCTTVAAGATQLTMAAQPGWQPELLVTPSSPTSYAISVARLPAGLSLKARLYSSEGSPSPVVTLTRSGAVYSGTANPGGPILSGYLHVWEDSGARREAVTDYALGGNPAPPAKPPKRKGRNAPALSPDGQVVLFSDNLTFNDGAYFAIQSLTNLPLAAPAWTVPVGFGYRLLASANAPSLTGTSLNMSYLESDVVPGTEGGIGMYYLPDGGTAWQRLTTRLDPRVNEVSAAALGPGTYVLMSSAGLRAGWNLLSYPWPTPTIAITEGMKLVGGTGKFTTVYGYDPSDAADPWEVYDIGVPAFVNDLSLLRYGRGYWVRASTGAAAIVADDAALAQAVSPERPATLYGTVAGGTAGRPVEARIGSTVCATTTTRSAGGSVVFVFDVPAAGERAGCGVSGAVVTVRVNGALFGATTWEAERPKEVRLGDTANRSIYLPLIRR